MSEELQKCSKCQCKKLLKFFKVKENTGKIYKTCIICCERFKCVLCEYKCALNSNLQKHIKAIHDKIKDYECDLCEYKCSDNGHLQTHIKAIHDKIKDYECEKCEYKCSDNGHLQTHIKQVHDKIKNFECDLCEYKCSKNGDLQRHILTCKGSDSTNMSGLELRTKEALEQLGFIKDKDYIFNCTYSKLTDFCGKKLKPDFRFIDHKIIIEADGSHHFKPETYGGISKERSEKQFIKTQECDQIKNDFCRIYGYKMIRIKYDEIKDVLDILHGELDDIITY
jgi:hypothetical protein